MELHLLKSTACLAILMIFYKFFLEKESMNVFKRAYLLLAVFISICIPFITFTTYMPPVPAHDSLLVTSDVSTEAHTVQEKLPYLANFFWGLYSLGVLFFAAKFFLNLRTILFRILRNPKMGAGSYSIVLLQEDLTPHTFWKYIFLNRTKYERKEIPSAILKHEQVHAEQLHSLDILFMEILKLFFWFNPMVYIVQNAIKLNHEFLADRAVLKIGVGTSTYQKILLSFSSRPLSSDLVNSITYKSVKKRFIVMKASTSKKTVWAKSMILLPLLASLVYSFSTTVARTQEIPVRDSLQQGKSARTTVGDSIIISEDLNIQLFDKETLILNGKRISYPDFPVAIGQYNEHIPKERRNELIRTEIITKVDFPTGLVNDVKRILYHYGIYNPKIRFLDVQEKATPEMMEEYNMLARHYNSLPKNYIITNLNHYGRMKFIRSRMSPIQKENAEQMPKNQVPPPPPKPEPAEKAPLPDISTEVPPPPPPPIPEEVSEVNIPTPPPSPVEYMKELAKKEFSSFFYDQKEISANEAIELVEKNKNLRIHVTQTSPNSWTIQLFSKD